MEFIKCNPLELSPSTQYAKAFRRAFAEDNWHNKLVFIESIGVKISNGKGRNDIQYYDFEIYCESTNFASACFHLGVLYGQYVLPISGKRHKTKTRGRKRK